MRESGSLGFGNEGWRSVAYFRGIETIPSPAAKDY